MGKEVKTNAMRMLDRQKIPYIDYLITIFSLVCFVQSISNNANQPNSSNDTYQNVALVNYISSNHLLRFFIDILVISI